LKHLGHSCIVDDDVFGIWINVGYLGGRVGGFSVEENFVMKMYKVFSIT